eukprot:CAMPEP_0173079800 /NCGR_PEP_ID=MMETSP1102-20130122/15481_1 /TAXON_ID=49646 /ORGANISM="Geminigera sp., Strain Caron Lab Isolate" /LENGTH=75 /DNA_ID=CAMNT_0013952435 /DNA_START=42 /DNA_END=269 /DNA_ORIENTATION=+
MGDPYATAPGTNYGPYNGPPMPTEVIYPDHTTWNVGINGEKPNFANTPYSPGWDSPDFYPYDPRGYHDDPGPLPP